MTETSTNKPTHTVYTVRDGKEGERGFWRAIGSAWTNRDGSFSLALDAVPVNGRLVMREQTRGRHRRIGQGGLNPGSQSDYGRN